MTYTSCLVSARPAESYLTFGFLFIAERHHFPRLSVESGPVSHSFLCLLSLLPPPPPLDTIVLFLLPYRSLHCRTMPAFEHALLVRVCQLLITQLQNLLDPTCEPALQSADLKIVLRVVRTVLRHFYRQLKTKCGVFIETLLAGM